jgi:hypothetical protein
LSRAKKSAELIAERKARFVQRLQRVAAEEDRAGVKSVAEDFRRLAKEIDMASKSKRRRK